MSFQTNFASCAIVRLVYCHCLAVFPSLWSCVVLEAGLPCDEQATQPATHLTCEWEFADEYSNIDTRSDCGMYAVAAAAGGLGRDFDVKEFLQSHPIVDPQGMSMKDILDVCKHANLSTLHFQNMNISTLLVANSPVILNFGAGQMETRTGHWVTFLGIKHGKLVVFDPGRTTKLIEMTPGELQMYWNGYGVIVSETLCSQPPLLIRLASLFPLIPLLVIATVSALLCKTIRGCQTTTLFGVSLMLLIISQYLIDPSSIGNNLDAARWKASLNSQVEIREASTEMIMAAISGEDVLIVDARPESEFKKVHLKGAVNVPINSDLPRLRQLTRDWPRDREIITICSRFDCGWSEQIARVLIDFGKFPNVQSYRPGLQGLADHGVPRSAFAHLSSGKK
jgi:rhodanese-related sulfurtransferase